MLYAWVQHYYPAILLILVLTALTIALLLAFYFRTLIGVLVPLFSGLLSALWALGFAGLCGFHLDPLVLVVFVLITARALSHSVQSMERYHEEYARLGDKHAAIVSSYLRLFDPAFVSVAADAIALLTLAVARIPVIQNLAFVASFWILTIAVSVITLHPVLLTFIPPPRRSPTAGTRLSDRFYARMCRSLIWLSQRKRRYVSVAVMVFSLTVGLYLSSRLQVGTVSIGEALMYTEHPYSVAARRVAEQFVGTGQMIVIVEGKVENALKKDAVLRVIEEFQWHMKQHGAVGSSSATSMIKRVFRLLHEGRSELGDSSHPSTGHRHEFFSLERKPRTGEVDDRSLPQYADHAVLPGFLKRGGETRPHRGEGVHCHAPSGSRNLPSGRWLDRHPGSSAGRSGGFVPL